MVSGSPIPVTRPEYVEVTADGWCAKVIEPEVCWRVLALEWVVEIEVGGEVGAPPRGPRGTPPSSEPSRRAAHKARWC